MRIPNLFDDGAGRAHQATSASSRVVAPSSRRVRAEFAPQAAEGANRAVAGYSHCYMGLQPVTRSRAVALLRGHIQPAAQRLRPSRRACARRAREVRRLCMEREGTRHLPVAPDFPRLSQTGLHGTISPLACAAYQRPPVSTGDAGWSDWCCGAATTYQLRHQSASRDRLGPPSQLGLPRQAATSGVRRVATTCSYGSAR